MSFNLEEYFFNKDQKKEAAKEIKGVTDDELAQT